MEHSHNVSILHISILICLGTFLLRLPVMTGKKHVVLHYDAKTRFPHQDHAYIFEIERQRNSSYRCYIRQAPFLLGRNLSHGAVNYFVERNTGRHCIAINGTISSEEAAKSICRDWADANQFFIDSRRRCDV